MSSKPHVNNKVNSTEGSHRNPPSPGKRRMVEANNVPRLVARGCSDSDEEVEIIRTQINPSIISRVTTDRPILNTSASRKRKTLNPAITSTPVVILPSPTTQIAQRIDSINLETLNSSTQITLSLAPLENKEKMSSEEITNISKYSCYTCINIVF